MRPRSSFDSFNNLLDVVGAQYDPAYLEYLRAYNVWAKTYERRGGAFHHFGPAPIPPENMLAQAPPPPQFAVTFDTIGQVIVRAIGNCRLAIKPIWAKGVVESGDILISNTQTFAGAVCAPIDQNEEGEIGQIWDGGSLVYNEGGAITPPGWSDDDAALLAASLASVVMYPGNETQLPADLIVADKGADKTNAFRGIRYFIFPDYPVRDGGLPQLSVEFRRTNEEPVDLGAVEFLGGSD